MKFAGAVILIVGLVFGAATLGGVFENNTNAQINKNVQKDIIEFAPDAIEKTKQITNDIFDKLQQKLNKGQK